MIEIIIFFSALFCEGFFSGSEIAIVSSDNGKLVALAKKNNKSALKLLKLKETPIKFLSVCLIGTNFFTATASFAGTTFILKYIPDYKHIAIIAMIPIMMTLGEIIPKTIYSKFATSISMVIVHPIVFFSRILSPVIFFLDKWTVFISSFFKKEEDIITKEEFLILLDNEKKSLPAHLQVIINRFKEKKDIEFALFGENND